MIATVKRRTRAHRPAADPTRAASYVRMSSDRQDRSPGQQRDEIQRLAEREGLSLVQEFIDEGISGDSGPDARPGFRAMLDAAERGEFSTLLVYDQDRLGRFDSLDGAEYFNRLRRSGVRILTVTEGPIDLETFEGRLVTTVKQEGRHAYLRDLSRKLLRGFIANARAGYHNGAKPLYGFDRAEFRPDGSMVRRLAKGDRPAAGNRVRLVPSEDPRRTDAVKYAFHRFASADVSLRTLTRELTRKGYPPPVKRWCSATVRDMLANPKYVGSAVWGREAKGKYFQEQAGEVVAAGDASGETDCGITVAGAHQGLIDQATFDKVQRRLDKIRYRRTAPRTEYPLAGLLVCAHCGQPMYGDTVAGHGHAYHKYLCQTYKEYGKHNSAGCGHYFVHAHQVNAWLAKALQDVFLGPGRAVLVQSIKQALRSRQKATPGDVERLQRRLVELETEAGRLVRAIRTVDDPGLTDELRQVKAEREQVEAELRQSGRPVAGA